MTWCSRLHATLCRQSAQWCHSTFILLTFYNHNFLLQHCCVFLQVHDEYQYISQQQMHRYHTTNSFGTNLWDIFPHLAAAYLKNHMKEVNGRFPLILSTWNTIITRIMLIHTSLPGNTLKKDIVLLRSLFSLQSNEDYLTTTNRKQYFYTYPWSLICLPDKDCFIL